MAQTIKLKRSATSGATPTTSQLELGEVAINTYDGKMYIKKDVGGTESIVEVGGLSSVALGGLSDVTISSVAADQLLQYNGSAWVNVSLAEASAIMKEYQFTATAGQSTFSGADDNSETLSYTAGAIQVFLNGIFLDSAVDYTATSGTSIVLTETVDANDYLQVVAFKKKIGDGNVSVDTFTGDDSTTAFTLSVDPGDENNTRVFIDGVYQSKSNYSVSGTTLTFSTAPPTDTAVEVEIGNRVVTLDTLSDLDLPDDVKLRLGTDQDLQIYHDGSNGFIKNTTGDLYIEDSNGSIRIRPKTGESGINVLADSAVELYYDNSKKLETTNDGVTVTGDVEADEFIGDVRGAVLFKAQAGESLAKGDVVYISGISGNTTIVSKADADDASKMPAFGLVAAAASFGNPVDIYTNGILSGIDTSSYSEGDELFVSTTAGALTATPPTGESSALQKIGKVTRSASSGSIFIVGAGRSNAVPNLDDGDIFLGNSSNQAVSASLNTKIEEYLDSGVSTPSLASLAVDSITIDGTEIDSSSSLLLDIAGNLTVNVDGTTVTLADDAINFGQFYNNASGQFNIYAPTQDKDIVFLGNDGGSTVTALTLDMSNAGAATFNSSITVTGTNANLTLGASGNDITFGRNADNYINAQAGTSSNIVINPENRFVVNTSDTERMRITSSGNVGIAKTNPGTKLDVAGDIRALEAIYSEGSAPRVQLQDTDGTNQFSFFQQSSSQLSLRLRNDSADGSFRIAGYGGTTTTDRMIIGSTGNFTFYQDDGSTEALFIDASNGNVGIGTNSPDAKLVVSEGGTTAAHADTDLLVRHSQAAGATAQVQILGGNTANSNLYFSDTDAYAVGGFQYNHSSNYLAVRTNNSEAMRIDSSGNLLVGTTAATAYNNSSDVYGFNVYANGQIASSVNGAQAAYFNRQNSDGIIADFRKDGTTVGSIGVQSDRIYFAGANEAVGIDDSWGAFVPLATGGGNSDADTDLGSPSSRFKDLYLSGGTWITGSVPRIQFNDSDGTNTTGEIRQLSDAIIIKSRNGTSNGVIRFSGDNGTTETEHARFDASGNLLVGTTNTLPGVGNTIAGISLYNDGRIFASKSANTTMSLNRNTSNGNILELRKDGSTVGSIGVVSDDRMYFATADGLGLQFDKDNNRIIPSDAAGGYNNNVELGDSTLEFTNLWLSGTVNVGSNTTISPDGSNGQIKQASGVLYYKSGEHNFQNAAGTTEYARFDTSGNLLVAKTSLNDNLAGFQTSPSGETRITRSGGLTLVLNRKTSDGEILGFRKDGTVVGNIGTFGTDLYIGTNDSGLRFEYAGLNSIVPFDVNSLAISDAATDLGHANARFKDLNLSGTVNAGTALVENAKLKAIAESNTDTAVDVFVYDTRKDSDGGAWRKRTQNTSWYNETLNTSTRGSRREFPCVAVIVALGSSGNNVTIYDGDDPSLPMWMQFTLLNQDQVSISAMNGTVCLGNNYTANSGYGGNGLVLFEFAADRSRHALSNGTIPSYDPERLGVISGNQTTTTIWPKNSAVGARFYQLVNTSVNDVAMTVLPNAPIDADTGLPVPTIAVATPGGVSVIKDDGTVVDITHTNYTSSYQVKFLPSGGIAYTTDTSSNQRWLHVDHTLPSSDNTKGIGYTGASDDEMYHTVDGSTYTAQSMKFSLDKLNAGFIVTNQGDITVGSSQYGIGLIARNSSLPSEGLIAEITSDYNTGYMHGDIKLATLSDTDTNNAASTDLLGGIGNFTDANAWTVPSGWSLSSNVATGSAVTAYLLPASNGILTAGKKYAVTVTQSSYTSGTVYMYMGTGAPSSVYYSNLPSTVGTFTYILTAYNSNFGIYGANYTGVIDNVTISLAEEDRSYNDNGLQVFGTVTKSAVATGAELVAYSGFSSSNYLEQSYNSDLDFGTGDFSYNFWEKHADSSSLQWAISRDRNSTVGWILIGLVAGKMRFEIAGSVFADIVDPVNVWNCWHFTRRSGVCFVYLNGVQQASFVSSANLDASTRQAPLRLGRIDYTTQTDSWHGSLALVRVSATAPSEEQIVKMYNDEKHLFAENADATIAGTSDAVTALAYDEDTELLHVGSSWGRSVFQGLNRVEYSTDVVSTAISASGGFIVEE